MSDTLAQDARLVDEKVIDYVTRRYGRVIRTRRLDYRKLSSVRVVDAKGTTSVVMVDESGVVPVPLMGRSDAWRARALIEGLRKPVSAQKSD